MAEALVFRLYGPFASWGEVAVGEIRPTATRPTRSALLGLVAAALGIRRGQEDEHRQLDVELRLAVRVEAAGVPLMDYHTVQRGTERRGERFATRSDEVRRPRHELSTLQTRRHHRCDAAYSVAMWHATLEPTWPLERLAEALRRPVFPLYLGRRACAPAWPLGPTIVSGESLEALFDRQLLPPLPRGLMFDARPALYWDLEAGPLAPALPRDRIVLERRDRPTSRMRRGFAVRREALHGSGSAATKGVNDALEPADSD